MFLPPVCLRCQVLLEVSRKNVDVIQTKSSAKALEPVNVYKADVWSCPNCQVSVAMFQGFVHRPYASEFRSGGKGKFFETIGSILERKINFLYWFERSSDRKRVREVERHAEEKIQ